MNRFGDLLPHLADNGSSAEAHFEPKCGTKADSEPFFASQWGIDLELN
ncbi:MAG: hypothetical protein ABIO92_00555 [Chloroflexia bacterium]